LTRPPVEWQGERKCLHVVLKEKETWGGKAVAFDWGNIRKKKGGPRA